MMSQEKIDERVKRWQDLRQAIESHKVGSAITMNIVLHCHNIETNDIGLVEM